MMESKCKWVRLGDYIEMRHENNSSLKYGAELIEGINSNGEFQATKAITENINVNRIRLLGMVILSIILLDLILVL